MGNTSVAQLLHLQKPSEKIFLGGLDASGKTTLLYKLILGQVVNSIPTIGFNFQSLTWNGAKLQFWDVGGGHMIRKLFKHYMPGVVGLVYIVDMTDQDRRETAMQDLWEHHLVHLDVKIPILIFANKIDLLQQDPNIKQLEKQIQKVAPGRKYRIVCCSGATGKGVPEGLNWLVQQINGKK